MNAPKGRFKRGVVLVLVASLVYISSGAHSPPTLAQQVLSAEKAESAGPGLRTFPTRLPRTGAAGSVVVPVRSAIDPARLQELKRQHVVPQAPIVRDQTPPTQSGPTLQPKLPTLQLGFNGLNENDNLASGFLQRPPDPVIAAGPAHVVSMVNSQVRISAKDGTTVSTTSLYTWFSPFGAFPVITDPRIVYDPQEGRWIFVALGVDFSSQVSRVLLSVSSSSDPTGGWCLYNLDGNLPYGPPPVDLTVADYPDIGLDGIPSTAPTSGAVYITANQFSFTSPFPFRTARVWILSKAQLYGCAGLNFWTTWDHLTSDGLQVFTYRAAVTYGNPGVEYLADSAYGPSPFIAVWSVTPAYPPTPPTFSGPATVPIGPYGQPPSASQPVCANTLDTIDTRLINAVWRNNRLYTMFTESNGSVSNIRYNQINTSGSPSLEVSASFGDGVSFYFIPAVTVDVFGNTAITFTRSSSSEFASAYFTGHLAGTSTLFEPSILVHSGVQCITGFRWGDYAGAAVDPADSTQLWLDGEWADNQPVPPTLLSSDWSWGTWVARVRFGFLNATLAGVYRFTATEVDVVFTSPPPSTSPPQYRFCNQTGGANFDGAGTVTFSGTQRCNEGGSVVNTVLSFQGPYCVNPGNGGFVIGTGGPGLPCTWDPIHGRIVGELGTTLTLLLDGTRRSNTNIISYMGVATPIAVGP